MVTVSDGQTNWIKQRLLAANISLFGVQFLDARSLRRELCVRADLPPPALGAETLRFLLRLHATNAATPGSEWSAVARHPEACLSALDDFAAAGWLDELGLIDDILPSTIDDWLPQLRATGSWIPDIDQRLADFFSSAQSAAIPLSICVFGWDANAWDRFNLLTAAVRAADSAYLYLPLPSGTAESIQHSWLEACEAAFGVERTDCDDSGFVSAQSALAERLEGADLDDSAADLPEPELLTGIDTEDTVMLVRDYVARWLSEHPAEAATPSNGGNRLAILCPGRGGPSVSLMRSLTNANIAVEDELGELPQPSLDAQIQRSIVDYHLDRAGLESLLATVELLNERAAIRNDRPAPVLREIFPMDAVEVRRALRGAFAEVQHHSARLLCDTVVIARTPVARSLRRLIDHLGVWPEFLSWHEALGRWQQILDGLGLTTEALEPPWSRLAALSVPDPVPSAAFFHYVGEILGGVPVRRDPAASHRFARVVVTTLAGAAGQTWGGVVLLESNEGAWPLYPPENPFLGDASRTFLNTRRTEADVPSSEAVRGHLLTSSDRAQLEHFHFLEILRNCRGPLAFAASSSDPADPNKELHPNEWVLRCLVEACRTTARDGERLLDRWRRTIRQTRRTGARLAKSDRVHLQEIWEGRHDPARPFDEYFFNFIALTGPDELPWAEAWSAGQLDSAWNRPASFALEQIFGSQPWHDDHHSLVRGESWVVGRLVHRWLHVALDATREPRRLTADDWARALTQGLTRARSETEDGLRARLAPPDHQPPSAALLASLPLWWESVLRKAVWATRRCLETLAETAAAQGDVPVWLGMNQSLQAELATASGPLRLRAQCDVVLRDRPELAGAVCQLIDIRTGATPAGVASSASQLAQGKGLHAVATLLLAVATGAEPDQSRAGSIHPDSKDLSLAASDVTQLAKPALERLARQQRSLVFGQKGVLVDAHSHGQAETLPLATSPVEPAVLAAKASITNL